MYIITGRGYSERPTGGRGAGRGPRCCGHSATPVFNPLCRSTSRAVNPSGWCHAVLGSVLAWHALPFCCEWEGRLGNGVESGSNLGSHPVYTPPLNVTLLLPADIDAIGPSGNGAGPQEEHSLARISRAHRVSLPEARVLGRSAAEYRVFELGAATSVSLAV